MPAPTCSRIVWSVIAVGVLTAATADGQTDGAPAPPLEVRAARVPRPPVIDGKLTDEGELRSNHQLFLGAVEVAHHGIEGLRQLSDLVAR